MKVTSTAMARSDSEDIYEVTEANTLLPGRPATMMKVQNVEDTLLDKPNDTTIHSGHFMVSHVHDEPPDNEDETETVENSSVYELEASPGQSPSGAGGGGSSSGFRCASSVVIDVSLRKLFECMTLAHCNKLTSPKWRNFKGVNVRLKDKIRLNNIIWREWHMQYIKEFPPIVCHFDTPEAAKNDVALDYWKLRLDSLMRDHKSLNLIFAHRFATQPDDHELLTRLLQRVSQSTSKMANSSLITVPTFAANDSVIMDDEAIKDIFDTLFTPYAPPSRGIPFSINTQSSIEEFMDTLEPLPPPLSVGFRGFGRLSSSTSGCSVAYQDNSFRMLNNQLQVGRLNNTNSATIQSNQTLPSVASQPLSFGSAEEILALLQSQLNSESSLECLMNDSMSLINSSGYSSGATVPSGFTVSDSNIVSTEGTSIPMLSGDGIEMQGYAGDDQLCSMFFLPDSSGVPVQSLPIFAQDTPGTSATMCGQQSLELNSGCVMQLQEFLQAAAEAGEVMPSMSISRPTPLASASLPRLKSSRDLSETRGTQSLGSIKLGETGGGITNTKGSALKPPSSKFRVPQKNTGARPKHCPSVLPQLQPRLEVTSSTFHRHDVQPTARCPSVILPKQTPQQPLSTTNWSPMMATRTDQLTVPTMTEQPQYRQDNQLNSVSAQGNQSTDTKHRVRHKSDQSNVSRGTGIRPIAVFQPINPLQTSCVSRPSSKATCSVSFLLDKNTTIGPDFPADPGVIPVSNLSNDLILSASGHSVGLATANQIPPAGMKTAFGENRSCPGIFETSSQSCDFSDALSHNSSSARSRHTSNESTGSHYDDMGLRSLKSKETGKQSKELRRVSHITAEQKRRSNIKSGFDTLINLVPDLRESPNSRVSKATALHKAAELCKKMKHERSQKLEEVEQLRDKIKALEADISACQSQLPATGALPIKQSVEPLNNRFDEYVYKRTLENWKFFIFGQVAQPLLKSFDEEVTRGYSDQMRKSILSWLQTHCSLASLRPLVTNALLNLSIQTSILKDPSLVPEEIKDAVLHQKNSSR